MATKNEDRVVKCSFCGKTQDQVRNIVAGPDVFVVWLYWSNGF